MFRGQQAEYAAEGLDWAHVAWADNADTLSLLEGRLGLLDLLDEACRFPRVLRGANCAASACKRSDTHPSSSQGAAGRCRLVAPEPSRLLSPAHQATASDLADKWAASPAVAASGRFTALRRPPGAFAVAHYAGGRTTRLAPACRALPGRRQRTAPHRAGLGGGPCTARAAHLAPPQPPRCASPPPPAGPPAGVVTYLATHFLAKNRDYAVAEHAALLASSSQELPRALFGPGYAAIAAAASDGSQASGPSSAGPASRSGSRPPSTGRAGPGARPAGAGGAGPGGGSGFAFRSVASQVRCGGRQPSPGPSTAPLPIPPAHPCPPCPSPPTRPTAQVRSQLGGLMALLAGCAPHYVRCVKPNPAGAAAGGLAPGYALAQLRCGGVMEAVRIAVAGYAYR